MRSAYADVGPLSATSAAPFEARIPGSKSYTNRALVLAAQRLGRTTITGALHSEDTLHLARALDSVAGLHVKRTEDGFVVVRDREELGAPHEPMDVGGAGTPARILLSFATTLQGASIVAGNRRLCERPMGHLLEAFTRMGVRFEHLGTSGCLPVRVSGGEIAETTWPVDGSVSSQFVTSLLLLAAQQRRAVRIVVIGHLVSRPYVEMTIRMMRDTGISVDHDDSMREITVTPARPSSERIDVETDASGMSYFLAAAALTRTAVRIAGIGRKTTQGDVGFAEALSRMGCNVDVGDDAITVQGAELHGVDIDMELMPDVVLTLAVVAARARGTTRITNIANLRVKECDRIAAAANELARLGVEVVEGADALTIVGTDAPLRSATVRTYDDHRVAMSFGLLRMLEPRIEIERPDCVAKSFAGYWEELTRFVRHHGAAHS